MASNESNREEEEEEERQFEAAFGNTQLGIRVNRIRNNDPDLHTLHLDRRDAYVLSDPAWELLGQYIANNNYLKSIYIYSSLCDSKASILFNALAGGNCSSLKIIHLSENNFGIAGVRSMVHFLQNYRNLSNINLSTNNNIDTAAFELLIRAIHGSPIKKLSLDGCSINDVSALGNSSLPLLQSLHLEENNIQSISALENYTQLQTLNLSGNNIGIDGCRTLSHLLQNEDSSLHTLDLNNIKIDGEGAEIIANSLKHNTKLESLDLDGNSKITERGFKAFLKILTDVSSIENTYNSNHTLTELFLSSDDVDDDVDDNIRWHIDNMLENSGNNPGRRKVIDYQLNTTDRTELANLQGITCTNNSVYAQIDPVALPDVLSLVGRQCSQNDLYCALVATASDLTSLVNKPVAIKEKIEKKKERIAHLTVEYNTKVGALTAEINELNEELQSLSLPGVSNSANTASENTTNTDNDSGKKRRIDS